MDVYLTEAEAAVYLKLHRDTLRKLRYRDKGPVSYSVGSQIRYAKKDLDKWADKRDVSGLLDHKEAAKHLRLHPETLRRYRREGKAPRCVQQGRKFLYEPRDLEAWLRGC